MNMVLATFCAHLDHLAYESSDPENLANFHADAMDMECAKQSDDTWHCSGPDRRLIFVRGENRRLVYAAFSCRREEELVEMKTFVEKNGVEVFENQSPWLGGSAFSVKDPDGHTLCFGLASGLKSNVSGIQGRLQHLTYATFDPVSLLDFYENKLGFRVTDRVYDDQEKLTGCFMTSSHEHHTIACFLSNRQGIDHHCHEAGEWNTIRDWCDHFAERHINLVWGPGRHGPGNNLFAFIEDPDGNMIEVSAELEVVKDRPIKDWKQEARTLNLWGWAINRTP